MAAHTAPRVTPARWMSFHPGDLVAGLSVACVLVPQSLAYAELAGMPAFHGLFAAVFPPIAAAFAASSPYLQTGPVAMTALLTFGALSVRAQPGSEAYVALAGMLALGVGLVRLLFGLARLGWVAYLMSQPVVTGFTSAAALVIIGSQLPTALGVAAGDGSLLARTWSAASHPTLWEPASVGLSGATLVLVLLGPRVHALFPGVLVAVVLGVAFSRATGYGGPVIGTIPAGLPPIAWPVVWSELPNLAVPAIIIALVGFAEPAAIARIYAVQDRRPWSPNREFVSQGLANVASGVAAGFPVGGSFSRTSVNRLAGGQTRWSGAVTGLVVLAFLPFAGLLSAMPRAVLGAIVIGAVVRLVTPVELWRLARVSGPQAGVAAATFGLTLALSPRVDQAVLVGIGLAGVVHIWRELRVQVRTSFHDGTLQLEPQGVLFFGSAPDLEEALVGQVSAHPDARRLVLDLEELGRIDYTGAVTLATVVEEAETAGLAVRIAHVPPHAQRILTGVFGPDRLERLAAGPSA